MATVQSGVFSDVSEEQIMEELVLDLVSKGKKEDRPTIIENTTHALAESSFSNAVMISNNSTEAVVWMEDADDDLMDTDDDEGKLYICEDADRQSINEDDDDDEERLSICEDDNQQNIEEDNDVGAAEEDVSAPVEEFGKRIKNQKDRVHNDALTATTEHDQLSASPSNSHELNNPYAPDVKIKIDEKYDPLSVGNEALVPTIENNLPKLTAQKVQANPVKIEPNTVPPLTTPRDPYCSRSSGVGCPKNMTGRKRLVDIGTDTRDLSSKKVKKEIDLAPQNSLLSMTRKQLLTFINNESILIKPDFIRLSQAMSLTYERCRRPVYNKGFVRIGDIMKFPGLRHYQMIKEEYGRITGNDVIKMQELENTLTTEGILTGSLEFLSKTKSVTYPNKVGVWRFKKSIPHDIKGLGMLALCHLFADGTKFDTLCRIFENGEIPRDCEIATFKTPTIVVKQDNVRYSDEDSETWIYVDGIKFVQVPNFYEALLTVFATFYILNIAYPQPLKPLFEYLDMLNGNEQSSYIVSKLWPPKLLSGEPFIRF